MVTPPIQWTKPTKPKVTSKPLPPTAPSKLVQKDAQSELEDLQRVKLTGGGDAKGPVKAEVQLLNHFVCWFETISANMNVEAQKRALSASQKATSSVLADEWYDEKKSDTVKVAPAQSDQRRVKYSTEMAEIGFPSQSQDQSSARDPIVNWQHLLNELQSARGQSDFTLPQPKCSRSQSRNQREDG